MLWPNVLTMTSSVSDVQTWTGEKKIVEHKNVKYALDPAYRFYIPQGVYICDQYTIVAKTSENPNIIYRNAIDDECGFLPLYQRRIAIRNAQLRGKKYFIYMVKRMSLSFTPFCTTYPVRPLFAS